MGLDLDVQRSRGGNSLIEAIQGSLLTLDKTEEGKPAGWHTMMLRCERIVKECYSSFGVEFRDTHDNFCDSPAFYATASPDWVIQYYIEEFRYILAKLPLSVINNLQYGKEI